MLINFTIFVPRHKRGRDEGEGKFLNPREKHNHIKAGTFIKTYLVLLIRGSILDFLIAVTIHVGGTVHVGTLFTLGHCSRRGTVHAGTIHENCFWVFGFVARVRARADNVFKGKVNNREIVENNIFFINE